MVRVKICGLKEKEDVDTAISFGIDALGFIFYKNSPRYIEPEKVKEIIENIEPFITTVGVFVDESLDEVKRTIRFCGISCVQFHGNESPSYCKEFQRPIKAFRVKCLEDIKRIEEYEGITWLIDKENNSKIHWDVAKLLSKKGRVILSGGLTPENVMDATNFVKPYAVDVSSGIEDSPGKKNHEKLKAFIENAKTSR
ncbi:TPA: N-(5'-phosphoribosyl)anthranilate isomerase [bacterium]|nr:N-(5'-phosphoribosyl)anthranilate isomerase [bacterium]